MKSESRKIYLTLAVAVLSLAVFVYGTNVFLLWKMSTPTSNLPIEQVVINPGKADEQTYTVEVATGEALETGLMARETAPLKGEGMLFDWKTEDRQSMTMYNVNFNLRVIWLDENYMVLGSDIMTPCPSWKAFFCPTWESPGKVRYALETQVP